MSTAEQVKNALVPSRLSFVSYEAYFPVVNGRETATGDTLLFSDNFTHAFSVYKRHKITLLVAASASEFRLGSCFPFSMLLQFNATCCGGNVKLRLNAWTVNY